MSQSAKTTVIRMGGRARANIRGDSTLSPAVAVDALMHAPISGGNRRDLHSAALAPLGAIYGAVAGARMNRPGARASVPVICIGDPTVGGSGKTPAAIAVAKFLMAKVQRPYFRHARLWRPGAGPADRRKSLGRRAAMSATSRCCSRASRPRSFPRTAFSVRASRSKAGASVIVMDDGFPESCARERLLVCWSSTAQAASATGACFRPGRCARR